MEGGWQAERAVYTAHAMLHLPLDSLAQPCMHTLLPSIACADCCHPLSHTRCFCCPAPHPPTPSTHPTHQHHPPTYAPQRCSPTPSTTNTIHPQMHYLNGRPANDTSGLVLHLSSTPVAYSAGMAAFATSFRIPPLTKSTLINNTCCYSGWEPLHGFAARVHTHAMGR